MHDNYLKQHLGTASSSNFQLNNGNYLMNSNSAKNLNGSTEQLFEDEEVERFDADTYKQKYGDRWKRLASSVRDIVQPDGTVIREYVIEDPGMLEQLSDNEPDESDETTSRNVPNVDDSNTSNNNSTTNTLRKQVAANSGNQSAGQVYFYDEKTKSFTNMNFNQLTEKIHGTSATVASTTVGNNYDLNNSRENYHSNNAKENSKEAHQVKSNTNKHETTHSKKSLKEISNENGKKQFSNHNNNEINQGKNTSNSSGKPSNNNNNNNNNHSMNMNYPNEQSRYDQYTIYNNNRRGHSRDREIEDEDKEVETIHEQGNFNAYFLFLIEYLVLNCEIDTQD